MNIEELNSKHFNIPEQAYRSSEQHTKISVEFAISMLESIDMSLHLNSEAIYSKRQQKFIEDKIQELKQYLNE